MPLPALLLAVTALSADPSRSDGPVRLVAEPAAVTLSGPHDACQVIVTGTYQDGSVRDLTGVVSVVADRPGIIARDGLFLRGSADGSAILTLTAGRTSVRVPVVVRGQADSTPVSFRNHVIAALNVGGCNMGACHGTPSGKNGFKLSLRGSDPAADFVQLTRDQFGRRADPLHPRESLYLLKALGQVPHEGGARLAAASYPASLLAGWVGGGLPDDSAALPAVTGLEVRPGPRVLLAPAKSQQLAVIAAFADGAKRDVTRLTCFSSSEAALADVSLTGKVEFKRPGEVAVLVRYLEQMTSVRLTYLEPRADFAWPNPPERNFVDAQVFAKLKTLGIAPSDLCADAEFVRRAYLDACGRMPTVTEAQRFLADSDPAKRDRLIDQLVTRPEFADFWALKWADVLRASRKTLQLKGTHAFQLWLRDRIATNTRFDAIARELLTAVGSTADHPAASYYRVARDPQSLAESTAQLFLGVRMQCAKCHNHPFERWTQDDYYSLAAVFARVSARPDPRLGLGAKPPAQQVSAEVVVAGRAGEVTQPRTGKVMPPRYPGNKVATATASPDRREAFADWLTAPGNPFFAKSVANRVWFHLMGRGIVDPVDDFRDSNPASNDPLLNALAADFAGNGFDLRRLVTTVMKSRTYQLSATPNATNADDARYFSKATTKLLTAEQLLDAVGDLTGVPEKFAGLPAGTRAIQLPDGEVNHPFLKTFGQPARELACECERESDGNLAQALQLINGPTVNDKVRAADNRVGKLLAAKATDRAMLDDLYLAGLSRRPTESETAVALAHVAKAKDRRTGWEDVLWAVINTREFLFRH